MRRVTIPAAVLALLIFIPIDVRADESAATPPENSIGVCRHILLPVHDPTPGPTSERPAIKITITIEDLKSAFEKRGLYFFYKDKTSVSYLFLNRLAVVLNLYFADTTRKAGQRNFRLFLVGPVGNGKTQIAEALHDILNKFDSDRPLNGNPPWVKSSISEIFGKDTFASLFFGVEKGVFTGVTESPGIVGQANGGTLFLDEVGFFPEALQSQILPFFELHPTYERVGGNGQRKQFNGHVILATNADLEDVFIEGLRSRMNYFFSIRVPSLLERKDELEDLIVVFAHKELSRYRSLFPRGFYLSDQFMQGIRDHAFNFRELQGIFSRAILRALEARHDVLYYYGNESVNSYEGTTTNGQRPPPDKEVSRSSKSPTSNSFGLTDQQIRAIYLEFEKQGGTQKSRIIAKTLVEERHDLFDPLGKNDEVREGALYRIIRSDKFVEEWKTTVVSELIEKLLDQEGQFTLGDENYPALLKKEAKKQYEVIVLQQRMAQLFFKDNNVTTEQQAREVLAKEELSLKVPVVRDFFNSWLATIKETNPPSSIPSDPADSED